MTVINADGVFLGNGRAWPAWSRRADAQWVGDQLDTRPRPVGGSGQDGRPAPPIDPGYRWPGALLRVGPVPGAAELPADRTSLPRDGRTMHAAPGAGSSALTDGAGLPAAEPGDGELAHHTAGEPRPDRAGRGLTIDRIVGLPLLALRRIRRWS